MTLRKRALSADVEQSSTSGPPQRKKRSLSITNISHEFLMNLRSKNDSVEEGAMLTLRRSSRLRSNSTIDISQTGIDMDACENLTTSHTEIRDTTFRDSISDKSSQQGSISSDITFRNSTEPPTEKQLQNDTKLRHVRSSSVPVSRPTRTKTPVDSNKYPAKRTTRRSSALSITMMTILEDETQSVEESNNASMNEVST